MQCEILPTETRNRLARAIQALEQHDWNEAFAISRTIMERPEAALLSGLALAGMGRFHEAARFLNAIARRRPAFAHPASDFIGLGTQASVATLFEACLNLDPDQPGPRQAFAEWLIDQGDSQRAADVLVVGARSASDFHDIGTFLGDRGAFPQAEDCFARAVALDPSMAPAWANLGMMRKVARRFDGALAAYATAIRLAPNDPAIRVNRMVALLQAGRWEIGRASCRERV